MAEAPAVIHGGGVPAYAHEYEPPGYRELGVGVPRDLAGEAYQPEDGDVFSADARVRAYDELHQGRHEALVWRHHNNRPVPKAFGAIFYSARLGHGKSLIMAARDRHFYRWGGMVFATTGNLFGQRTTPRQVVMMGDEAGVRNYMQSVDEVHALIDRMGRAAYASRLFRNSGALARKDGVRGQYASAREWDVGYDVLRVCEWFSYPTPYGAGQQLRGPRRRRYGGGLVSSSGGRRRFPPWCYVFEKIVGPWPMEGVRLLDQLEGRAKRLPDPPRPFFGVSPLRLYQAAQCYDTFESPSIRQALDLTADRLRKKEEDDDAADQGVDLRDALRDAIMAGAMQPDRKRAVPTETLMLWADEHGYTGDLASLRRILRAHDVLTSHNAARIAELLEFLGLRPKED